MALNQGKDFKTATTPARQLMKAIGDNYIGLHTTLGWHLFPLIRPKVIQAVVARSYGRFGNQIVELASAIALAKALKVNRVVLEDPRPFVPGSYSFGEITVEVRENGVRLNSFLDVIVGSFTGFRPEIQVAGASCLAWIENNGGLSPTPSSDIYQFVGSIIDWPKTGNLLPADHLVAHLRSGDVFLHPVNKTYGQLPLSFYQLCVRTRRWAKVWVVAEDTMNPVVNEFLTWLANERIEHEFHSRTLEEDIALLCSARNLVASRGTFVASIAATVSHNPHVFFMEQQSLPIDVHNSTHIRDRCGNYREAILQNNWELRPEQLEMMVSYSIECLEVQGSSDDRAPRPPITTNERAPSPMLVEGWPARIESLRDQTCESNYPFRRGSPMHAMFCVDKAGLKHFAVAATSLAMNRPPNLANAFLLTVDVSESQVSSFFTHLAARHGLNFTLIQVPREKFDPFPVFGHVTAGSYFRLMIAEALPEDVSEVLYLDTDIVVNRSLDRAISQAAKELASSDSIVAAVPEHSEPVTHLHAAGVITGPYLQAGVMLINVARWRESFSLEVFIDIYRSYEKNIVWWDQDILNIAFQQRWIELPVALNGTPGKRTPETAIYHYAGNQKPWRFRAEVHDKEIYEHYRRQTQILRPPRIDPQTVVTHYTKPFRTAEKVLRKKLGLKSRKR